MNKRIKETGRLMRLVSESLYPDEFKSSQKYQKSNEKYQKLKNLSKSELLKKIENLENIFNFHRSIIQHLNTGLITLDEEGIITYSNQPAAKMIGCTIDKLLNRNIENFIVRDSDSNRTNKASSHNVELYLKHSSGDLIPIRANFDPFSDKANKHIGIILGFQDISEIRQIERMSRLFTLGEVSAGIAHEIRNPLAGAKSIAQALVANFEDDKKISDYTSRIIKEIDRVNLLLLDFFKFAKPNKPQRELYDTEAFLENAFQNLRFHFERFSIKLETDFSTYAPHFYADKAQIEQVFNNLIFNAIDAVKEISSPTIIIKTSKQNKKSAKTKKEEVYTIIEISDNGTGIAEQNKELIFNPFFSTKHGGVGLGLSISSRLMEENNGELDFYNNKNQGTSFIMLLPTS